MRQTPVNLSLDEIQALLEMAETYAWRCSRLASSGLLFRMKFIDSLPGHEPNFEKVRACASAVSTLQEAFKKAKGFKAQGAA